MIANFRNWLISKFRLHGSKISYPSFTLKRRKLVCLVGSSGSGKSSLLDSLAGHLSAVGCLRVNGQPITPSNPRWQESCGFVRQEPELILGDLLDNLDNFLGWRSTLTRKYAVSEILKSRKGGTNGEVAIDDKGVSVGQRRAISVIRTIGTEAPILFLDEPIAGIDNTSASYIRDVIIEGLQEKKLILLTAHKHDLERFAFDDVDCSVINL